MNLSREALKGNKLEYLYLFDELSWNDNLLPLLGSALRSIGKGWNTIFVVERNDVELINQFKKILKNQNRIQLFEFDSAISANIESAEIIFISLKDSNKIKMIREKFLGKINIMASQIDSKNEEDYDLISKFTIQEHNSRGVFSFTGNGKGKTTSSYGMGIKEITSGEDFTAIQWFKEKTRERGSWSINEHFFPDETINSKRINFFPTGLGFFESPNLDRIKGQGALEMHRAKAKEGLEKAKKIIRMEKYQFILLDEFIDTVPEISQNIVHPLLEMKDIIDLLEIAKNSKSKIIISGRRIVPELEKYIHKSYSIKSLRHPFTDRGKKAVSGIDF